MNTKPKQSRQSLAPRLIALSGDATVVPEKKAQAAGGVRRVNSKLLLGDECSLVIEHEGVPYILRATRLGKLILTK